MPCYTEPPTREEEEIQRTSELIREIEGKKFNHSNPRFTYYGDLQANVKKLCAWCKLHDVQDCSLELQIWWRDHQIEDARHENNRLAGLRRRRLRKSALSKLTKEELAALRSRI